MLEMVSFWILLSITLTFLFGGWFCLLMELIDKYIKHVTNGDFKRLICERIGLYLKDKIGEQGCNQLDAFLAVGLLLSSIYALYLLINKLPFLETTVTFITKVNEYTSDYIIILLGLLLVTKLINKIYTFTKKVITVVNKEEK